MNLGANRKQMMILGGLVLVGGYVLWTNVFSGPDTSGAPAAVRGTPSGSAVAVGTSSTADSTGTSIRRRGGQNRASEWNLIYKDPKKTVDPSKVDPTLRLDLLAKVQQVNVEGAQRNLFDWGQAAAPKPVAGAPGAVKPLPPVPPINMAQRGAALTGDAPVPVSPPIALKYYGYSNPRNNVLRKRAFFLDGDDIIVASEGDLIKRRYKLVKIGVNSVTMEDTQFNNQQQLPLAQDVAT